MKASQIGKLILPLLFINITVSANLWQLAGADLGQIIYWFAMFLTFVVALHSKYSLFALVSGVLFLFFTIVYFFLDSSFVYFCKMASRAGLMFIVGAEIYGKNPAMLKRHLQIFLVLCIPIMLAQLLGLSSVFMYWNTEYAHDLTVLTPEEIGTFKKIPVYPTFLVPIEDFNHQIGQTRPVGLLYANNILSIFISIATALTFSLHKDRKLYFDDLVVMVATVLSMSLLANVSCILVILFFFCFGNSGSKVRSLKLLSLLALFYFLYQQSFPGAFETTTSLAKFWHSVLLRVMDVVNALGLTYVQELFQQQLDLINYKPPNDGDTYSTIGLIFNNEYTILLVVLLAVAGFYLINQIRKYKNNDILGYALPYVLTLFACVFSQFAVTYMSAPSFQLMLGFCLYPVFGRIWRKNQTPTN
jgi:hypothetical protein